MRRKMRPPGSPEAPVRSVRVDQETWDRANTRAALEGKTMSEVLLTFVEGYGRGLLSLPRVEMIYEASIEDFRDRLRTVKAARETPTSSAE